MIVQEKYVIRNFLVVCDTIKIKLVFKTKILNLKGVARDGSLLQKV